MNAHQLFSIRGAYTLPDVEPALELRLVLTVANAQGATARAVQLWSVDAVPPWIHPTTPAADAVVLADTPVVISATFGDSKPVAAIAGGKGAGSTPQKGGPVRGGTSALLKGTAAKTTVTHKAGLGPWTGAVAGSLDEVAANSGIDTTCVELTLHPATGKPRLLTSEALISPAGITWSGMLAEGQYTVLLAVCDEVCNTASAQWNFTVSRHAPGEDNLAPVIVSLEPNPADTLRRNATPTFIVGFAEQGNGELDSASISLRLEAATGDTVRGELTINLAESRAQANAMLRVGALPLGSYRLFAEASDLAGNRVDSIWTYTVGAAGEPETPADFVSGIPYNYPNPFDAGTNTRFWLPLSDGGGAQAQIRLFDFAGKPVKDLFSGAVTSATVIEWNGTNNSGERVANGVYLAHVRLSAGGRVKEDIVKVAFRSKQ